MVKQDKQRNSILNIKEGEKEKRKKCSSVSLTLSIKESCPLKCRLGLIKIDCLLGKNFFLEEKNDSRK